MIKIFRNKIESVTKDFSLYDYNFPMHLDHFYQDLKDFNHHMVYNKLLKVKESFLTLYEINDSVNFEELVDRVLTNSITLSDQIHNNTGILLFQHMISLNSKRIEFNKTLEYSLTGKYIFEHKECIHYHVNSVLYPYIPLTPPINQSWSDVVLKINPILFPTEVPIDDTVPEETHTDGRYIILILVVMALIGYAIYLNLVIRNIRGGIALNRENKPEAEMNLLEDRNFNQIANSSFNSSSSSNSYIMGKPVHPSPTHLNAPNSQITDNVQQTFELQQTKY